MGGEGGGGERLAQPCSLAWSGAHAWHRRAKSKEKDGAQREERGATAEREP